MCQLLSAIVNRTWSELARHGNLQNWREILAVLVTYAGPEDFATLCGEIISHVAELVYKELLANI